MSERALSAFSSAELPVSVQTVSCTFVAKSEVEVEDRLLQTAKRRLLAEALLCKRLAKEARTFLGVELGVENKNHC